MSSMVSSFDNILYRSAAAQHPPLVKGGIPNQWLPGWIRWPLRVLFYPFILLDAYAQKIAKFFIRPLFKQIGSCKKRGNCCHYILMKKSWGLLGTLDLFWNTQVNGFFLREKTSRDYQGKQVYVLGCRYLRKDGQCTHYRLRPSICRSWPRIEIFGTPQVLKGCGFQVQDRGTGNILTEKDLWDRRFSIFASPQT